MVTGIRDSGMTLRRASPKHLQQVVRKQNERTSSCEMTIHVAFSDWPVSRKETHTNQTQILKKRADEGSSTLKALTSHESALQIIRGQSSGCELPKIFPKE
jgi:hypothetical protein